MFVVIVVVAQALLTVCFDSEFESAVKQLGGRLKSQIILKIHLIWGKLQQQHTATPLSLFRVQATPAVLY